MATNPATTTPIVPHHRRFRFTLRLLLAGITLLCIGLAVWTHRAREQRRIVGRILLENGLVGYDCDELTEVGTRRQSPFPNFLLDGLGVDYFHAVKEIRVHDSKLLPELVRFRQLERLEVHATSLSDGEIAPLAQLPGIKDLTISKDPGDSSVNPPQYQVSDKSIETLAKLSSLEYLSATGAFTSRGIGLLAGSKSLQTVEIYSSDVGVDSDSAEPIRRTGRVKNLRIFQCSNHQCREIVKWGHWGTYF
jgi:hypothetical protein